MADNTKLPIAPKLRNSLGPSFILLGLALGSGELIMWPYLSSQYGLGLIWGGLLGITLQFFLNTEVMRYTLAWGESVFVGWRRWGKTIPMWFILSTTIPWVLPGFSASTAAIINHLLPSIPKTAIAVSSLLLTGVIISSGKTLYKTMEKVQKYLLLFGLPFIFLVTLYIARGTDWLNLFRGLIGHGEGWRWFPPGVSLGAFLGAFAYSGAGGNLNLAQSYYIKEKGFGMGTHYSGIKSLLQIKSEEKSLKGRLFSVTPTNISRWRVWWRLVVSEHFIVFWGLGLLTIILLAVLSAATARGAGTTGIDFLYFEASTIAQRTFPFIGTIFLVVAALMLFATQLGVLESATRITAENILLIRHKVDEPVNAGKAFYLILWLEILVGVVLLLLGFQEPRLLLTLGAMLNACAMLVAFPLILLLNRRHLPTVARPSLTRQLVLILATIIFAYFVYQTITTAQWF
ncbi:MAG: Nramp family divalent metal transporter [bacterium]